MSYLTNNLYTLQTVEVDATTVGTYLIGNTPPGFRFCPVLLTLEPIDVAGVGGGATYATVSIGTNSTSYDNWINASALPAFNQFDTTLTGVGGASPPPSVGQNIPVYVNVSVATTNITTYKMRFSISGILYNIPGIGP